MDVGGWDVCKLFLFIFLLLPAYLEYIKFQETVRAREARECPVLVEALYNSLGYLRRIWAYEISFFLRNPELE